MNLVITASLVLISTLPLQSQLDSPLRSPSLQITAPAFDVENDAGDLQLALRELWSGHIFWVRAVVLASHYGDEAGSKAAEDKVVENARALGESIEPVYGKEAADQLFGLLAGHYGATKEYMTARYGMDQATAEKAGEKLNANALEIAVFLSTANPHLPKEAVHGLLLAHTTHHMQQIDAVHKKQFESEAKIWDAMQSHINGIADALANALVKQFPDKLSD